MAFRIRAGDNRYISNIFPSQRRIRPQFQVAGGILALLLAAGVGTSAVRLLNDHRILVIDGATAAADITDINQGRLTYRFIAKGNTYYGTASSKHLNYPGRQPLVTYRQSDPEVNTLDPSKALGDGIVMLAMCGALAIIGVSGIRRRWRPR